MNLCLLVNWAASRGLGLKPFKRTEKRLFASQGNMKLNFCQLCILFDRVKYLELILDGKLSWKPNMKERAKWLVLAASVEGGLLALCKSN